MNQLYGRYSSTRKKIRTLLIVWTALRTAQTVLTLILVARQILVISLAEEIATLAVVFVFAYFIYQGYGTLTYLPMIGGAYTVLNALRFARKYSSYFHRFPSLALYSYGTLIIGVVQIVLMVLLITRPQSKEYFQQAQALMKQEKQARDAQKKAAKAGEERPQEESAEVPPSDQVQPDSGADTTDAR
jgi:hypothetical protein